MLFPADRNRALLQMSAAVLRMGRHNIPLNRATLLIGPVIFELNEMFVFR